MSDLAVKRIQQLQEALPKKSAFFVSNPSDIFYLTGENLGSDAFLLITSKDAFFITDSRYREELESIKGAKGIEIELDLFSTIDRLLARSVRVIFVQGKCPIAWLTALRKSCAREVTYSKEIDDKVKAMRMIKDKEEIKILRQNFSLHKRILSRWKKEIIGKTERESALHWLYLVHRFGADDVSFPPIVAVGPSASRPHYTPGRRRITGRFPVLFDAGIKRKGYCTDLTRNFFTDRMNQRYRNFFSLVMDAQAIAISSVKPGVVAKELDRIVRNFFRRNGVEAYFLHGLGHGLGIDVHEFPVISSRSNDELKPGMVFTIEPGLYVKGKFGVRIEDVVVVTEDGCEVISK